MPNPVTDYKLKYSQADIEWLAQYILRNNPGIGYNDAYQRAVRRAAAASGEERRRLR